MENGPKMSQISWKIGCKSSTNQDQIRSCGSTASSINGRCDFFSRPRRAEATTAAEPTEHKKRAQKEKRTKWNLGDLGVSENGGFTLKANFIEMVIEHQPSKNRVDIQILGHVHWVPVWLSQTVWICLMNSEVFDSRIITITSAIWESEHIAIQSFLKHPDLKQTKTSTNCTELNALLASANTVNSSASWRCSGQSIWPWTSLASRMTSLVSDKSCHLRSLQAFARKQAAAMALKKDD